MARIRFPTGQFTGAVVTADSEFSLHSSSFHLSNCIIPKSHTGVKGFMGDFDYNPAMCNLNKTLP